MFEVLTYNPEDVYLSIGGYNCAGWDEISIERATPAYKLIKGIRGKHTRIKDEDTSALVTISLMQVSPTNDVLSELHTQDIIETTGRLDLLLIDKSGNSKFGSSEAYITGYPKRTFKDSIEYVVWTIQCQTTDNYIVGGNNQPNSELINKAIELFS